MVYNVFRYCGLQLGGDVLKKAIVLLILTGVIFSGCVTTGSGLQSAAIKAKDKVAPALVHIRPVKEVFSRGKREEVLVVGSGFIISEDGYVITNEHVAGKSKFVRCVLYNKEEIEAQVVGVDPYTDIAVLKLNTENESLPYVKLGRSSTLQAGQTVLALGSPHGLARSVSQGIVSVTDRYLESRGVMVSPYNTWIQTDAAINPGNSGGPLVNLKGEVVGVNARTMQFADNVGFAIPIDIAREVVDQIIEYGRVKRSWLGLTLQEMTRKTDDLTQKGVVIADVDPLAPGYDAGLRPGDVLLSVNTVSTNARFREDLPQVQKLIADFAVGTEVVLSVSRGEEFLDIKVVTVEKSELKGKEVEFTEWGFSAIDLTPRAIRRAQLTSKKGIAVSGTQVGSISANANMKRGDIILTVDGEEIENLVHFREVYDKLVESKKKLIMLDVKQLALTRFVLIKQVDNGSNSEDSQSE